MKFNYKIVSNFKNPRIRHGSIATTITIFVIILAIGINILAAMFTEKYGWNFDLTKNQAFNITEESLNYISNINKDVEIIVLNSKEKFIANGDYYKQASSVIDKYAQNSDKIKVSYLNITENPAFAAAYPNDELDENDIIVTSGDKHTVLSASDLFDVKYSYYGSTISSSQAEQSMTSAILNVSTDQKIKISLISGFDETDSSAFVDLLEKNNYEIVSQKILTEDISSDAKVAVIYGPTRDYDKEAIAKLNSYLSTTNSTKSVFYVLNPAQPVLPNLEAFLMERNIRVGDGIVFESDYSKLLTTTNPYYTINEYMDTKYTEYLKGKDIPVTIPFSKPLEVLDSSNENTNVLLQFSETAGIIPSNAGEDWQPTEADIKGPIPSAICSYDETTKSNVIVVGSIVSFDSGILSRTSLNNSAYFLNMFNLLTENKTGVIIESKTIGGQNLGITATQALQIGIAFTIVLPLLILIWGIIVWLRRRKHA